MGYALQSQTGLQVQRLTPLSDDELRILGEQLKRLGPVVFANGCFDGVHEGHRRCIGHATELARRMGGSTVIGLNSSDYIRRHKRATPLMTDFERVTTVAALPGVNAAFIYTDPDCSRVVTYLRPDFVVRGPEYPGQPVIGAKAIRDVKAQVVYGSDERTISSTKIYERRCRLKSAKGLR